MTFLEAAIEILRRADGPMHFGEIARQAVEQRLLSHVGRDPETAMRSCLTSAVRSGPTGEPPIIVRSRPGYYALRAGAQPPGPPRASAAKTDISPVRSESSTMKPKDHSKRVMQPRTRSGRRPAKDEQVAHDDSEHETARRVDPKKDVRRGRRGGREVEPRETAVEPSEEAASPGSELEFAAPSGSGLEGVTDVALVMANAMSRLVEERPELREEFEAIQHGVVPAPAAPVERERTRTRQAPRDVVVEERPSSRRRRRRRRRGKRVEWAAGVDDAGRGSANLSDKLLDGVAEVLTDAGTRSLHVRQIAETLAGKGVLGGEISEIERAVTAAVLLDIHDHGRASRFVARGDARYQLQGSRLPTAVAQAEQGARDAVRKLDRATRTQLESWLAALGARALESLVRIWLQREGHTLVAALPPNRGLGKLIVEDGEDEEGRTLVLVVPKRTGLDPKLWEGEAERNDCNAVMVFTMAEVPEHADLGESRIIGTAELAEWLREQSIGVHRAVFEAYVLDPNLIEAVGGLDT